MDKNQINQELAKYNITDAAIQELKQKYSGLTIKSLEDKEGYGLVHDARIDLRDKRVAVEKTRKELKADSLEYGRMVDAEAKRITALIEPLELELAKQEEIIDNEKKRIKEEAEKKAQEILNTRIAELAKYGAAHDVNELKMMQEASFDALLKHFKGIHEAEEKKKLELEQAITKQKEEEARLAKIESDRIAKEKSELEEKQKTFEKEQAAVKAEQEKATAELKAKQDALDKEKREHEAIIQKQKEEEKRKIQEQHNKALGAQMEREKIEKEQKEKEAQKALKEIKAKRAEALKPDKDKILVFIAGIQGMQFPSVKHDDAKKLMANFKTCLDKCCESIINESKNL